VLGASWMSSTGACSCVEDALPEVVSPTTAGLIPFLYAAFPLLPGTCTPRDDMSTTQAAFWHKALLTPTSDNRRSGRVSGAFVGIVRRKRFVSQTDTRGTLLIGGAIEALGTASSQHGLVPPSGPIAVVRPRASA
jgi:hypothetical protein